VFIWGDDAARGSVACSIVRAVKSCGPPGEFGHVDIRSRAVRLRRLVTPMSLAQGALVAFIPTRDAERSRAFYESTLGLRVVADTPFALILDSRGTTIRIQKVETFAPHPFTALGWTVVDIVATMAELRGRGVAFERYASMPQDESGIWTTPDGTRVAWFKDPDGNTLAVSEPVRAMSDK
jgi:catechol 2,3-dioxygenase-like lactoylglutathione lyase family enzyme